MRSLPLFSVLSLAAVISAVASLALAAEARRSAAEGRKTPPTATAPAAPKTPPAKGFEAFQLVLERNIFNPNRVGRTRATVEEKALRVEEISLVGIVRYDGEKLAIFDSSEAAYRKGFREGDAVAEFKVQQIAADSIELVREIGPLTLRVAQQLRRVEGGDWKVGANQAARVDPGALSAGGSGGTNGAGGGEATAAELPADASEVLKRLMKKREKQLK